MTQRLFCISNKDLINFLQTKVAELSYLSADNIEVFRVTNNKYHELPIELVEGSSFKVDLEKTLSSAEAASLMLYAKGADNYATSYVIYLAYKDKDGEDMWYVNAASSFTTSEHPTDTSLMASYIFPGFLSGNMDEHLLAFGFKEVDSV